METLEPLVWHCEKRIVNNLIPWERNPRQMTKKQVGDLKASLERLNLIDIPAIDTDETLVGGHQRCKILQLLGRGEEEIDVRVPNRKLTEEEFQEANLRLNKNLGEFDPDLLVSFPEDLLKDVGFTDEELSSMFQLDMSQEPAEGEDDIPDPPAEPKSKLGDLYQLGRHRLLCGDSTKREDVERLMDGEKADMVFTDPPYGIKEKTDRSDRINTFKNKPIAGYKKYPPIIGDDSFNTALSVFNLINNLGIDSIIYWGGNCFSHLLPQTFSWIVWDKKVEEKNTDNQGDCELAWVKSNKFQKSVRAFRHIWKGMIKDSEQGEARVHPTQKPIALCEWCFDNYGCPEKILDLFGGSGSTLIAAEKTNRRCFMMEISEQYCDVIIERWETFTGQKVVKL